MNKKRFLFILTVMLSAGFVGSAVALPPDAAQMNKLKIKVLKQKLLRNFGGQLELFRMHVNKFSKHNPQRAEKEKDLKLYEDCFHQLIRDFSGDVSDQSLLNLEKAFDLVPKIGQ